MKKCLAVVSAAFLFVALQGPVTGVADAANVEKKREKIDRNAKQSLERLMSTSDKAEVLYNKAHGYAVFSVTKVAFIITGGGGSGVAVNKTTGQRIYMNMGTGGLALGLGGQAYQVVFMFQDPHTFDSFVQNGWDASAEGNAVAGRAGANAAASFTNGLAVFALTEAGLMLSVDISGTKYWQSANLNAPQPSVETTANDT